MYLIHAIYMLNISKITFGSQRNSSEKNEISNYKSLKIILIPLFIIPHEPAVVTDYTNCLTQLIKYNFKESGNISISSTKNYYILLSRIKSEVLKNINDKPKYYVEILSSTKEEPLLQDHQDKLRLLKLKHQKAIPSIKYNLMITENETFLT